MAKYGKTYWGSQFLNALEHIDYSNRLPRGRSYASNGSVRSILIEQNKIHAKVQGSRRTPYSIEIIVPEFTNKEKEDLIEAIQTNPSILASLLNRQLPNDLLKIATDKGIKIFPRQWRDFEMECSCPDWAVPCKHLAAVIYLLANEIDLNPFKVLELHGLDVLNEITKQGIELSANVEEKIETWDENFSEIQDARIKTQDKRVKANSEELISIEGLNELDFTFIPKTDDKFLNLLTANPPFYEKDFKKELLTNYRYAIKNANHYSSSALAKSVETDIYNVINASIIIKFNKPDLKFQISNYKAIDAGSKYQTIEYYAELDFENEVKRISLLKLIEIFEDNNDFKISQTCDSIKVLYHYYLFAKKLTEQGAIIPQLTSLKENFIIQWIPLLQDSSVRLQSEILNRYSKYINVILEEGTRNLLYRDTINFATCLTSIFNNVIISNVLNKGRKINKYDDIQKVFFGELYNYNEKSKNIINSIQLWLNKLHSNKRTFTPILQVEEKYPRFNVSLHIKTNTSDKIEAPVEFHQFKKKNRNQIFTILKDLQQLEEHFGEFKTILNSNEKQSIEYNAEKFAEFLFQIIPVLNLLGVEILLPKSLKYIVKPEVSLQAKTTKTASVKTYMDLISILQFDWQVAIGDELMNEKEFVRLVKGMEGIIKIKDNFIHVTKEELDRLIKHLESPHEISRNEMLQVLFANEYNGSKIEISAELQEILKQFRDIESVALPTGLKAELRAYQLRGYEWLYKNSKIGFGSILADDMGLGKTIQTIAILQKLKEEKILEKEKAIVIMPTTLLTNWSKEIQKFAPTLTYHIYHGSKRDIKEFGDKEILLTSYGIARSDAEILNKLKWQVLIIDEAQNIKNHTTAQTKAIKTIQSNYKIALSGTPVENRLSEYWSIFDFTNKGYLGTVKNFNEEYARPITIEKSHKKLEVFKKITSPFIMRRMKTDKQIISDLPDKIENNQYCGLTKEQAALYEGTVKSSLKSIEHSEGIERKGMVLKMMIALKQIGNHPFQYLKSGANSPELSGKIMILFELLHAIIDNSEKTLIFTQYKEMGDLLQTLIREEFKTEPLFLHGSLTRKQRETMVEDFQNKLHRKIFILSLKAGGTGLNLTEARNVIHYDLWWNPAVETQATDRAYRIGQKNKVMVYRLINKGTLEERIDEMIKDKKELADLTVSTGEKWIGELSNKELKELVKLTKEV